MKQYPRLPHILRRLHMPRLRLHMTLYYLQIRTFRRRHLPEEEVPPAAQSPFPPVHAGITSSPSASESARPLSAVLPEASLAVSAGIRAGYPKNPESLFHKRNADKDPPGAPDSAFHFEFFPFPMYFSAEW